MYFITCLPFCLQPLWCVALTEFVYHLLVRLQQPSILKQVGVTCLIYHFHFGQILLIAFVLVLWIFICWKLEWYSLFTACTVSWQDLSHFYICFPLVQEYLSLTLLQNFVKLNTSSLSTIHCYCLVAWLGSPFVVSSPMFTFYDL